MCGAIAYPEMPSGDRFRCWWAANMEWRYTIAVSEDETVLLLGGSDAWALRCAFLHLGSDRLDRQRAREALDKFIFVTSDSPVAHLSRAGRFLRIDVRMFCDDICAGVERFLAEARRKPEWQGQVEQVLRIVPMERQAG